MSNLTKANREWASRPADERFTSLVELNDAMHFNKANSSSRVVSSRELTVRPAEGSNHLGIEVVGPNGQAATPTFWSFGQLAMRAGAPAGYLRELPAELAADNLNYGLQVARGVEEARVLLSRGNESIKLRAITGPGYGRIWNSMVSQALLNRFGDGVTGDFRVPGEFGKEVEITKANTTLYASDQDMFVFLADEKNRIELPNRRDGHSGALARGFFVWNSEVGAQTLGIATFLFDYVCCNRIVWGAKEYREIKIRHTSGAPDRWIEEVVPAIEDYVGSSTSNITRTLIAAQREKVAADKLGEFLKNRFTKSEVAAITNAHEHDEQRPIETVWDVVVGATAYARSLRHQDARVEVERKAGLILDMVAV